MPSHQTKSTQTLARNRQFTIFWIAQSIGALGDSFTIVALPLLIYQATHSVAQMGLITGTIGIGRFLTTFFAGVVADNVDRRRMLIIANTIVFLLYGSIPVVWFLIGPAIFYLYIVVAIASINFMFLQVGYVAAIPMVVDSDQIISANSRLQGSIALTFVLGPLLAGVISASVGPVWAVGANGVTGLVGAMCLTLIHFSQAANREQSSAESGLKAYTEGMRYLFSIPVLRTVAILDFFFFLILAGALDLYIFHIKHDLGQNDTVVGLILGLASIGGIAGSIAAPILRRKLGFGWLWLGGFALDGVFIALIGVASHILALIILSVVFMFCDILVSISSLSLRQEVTPNHLLGRVSSAFYTFTTGPAPIGAPLLTLLSAHIGVPKTLAIAGSFVVLLAVIGVFTPARIRIPPMPISADTHLPEPLPDTVVTR